MLYSKEIDKIVMYFKHFLRGTYYIQTLSSQSFSQNIACCIVIFMHNKLPTTKDVIWRNEIKAYLKFQMLLSIIEVWLIGRFVIAYRNIRNQCQVALLPGTPLCSDGYFYNCYC